MGCIFVFSLSLSFFFIYFPSALSRMYVLTADQGQGCTKEAGERNESTIQKSCKRKDSIPNILSSQKTFWLKQTGKQQQQQILQMHRVESVGEKESKKMVGHGRVGAMGDLFKESPSRSLGPSTLLFIEGIYRSDFPEVILSKMPVLITSRVLPVPHFTAGWAQAAGDPAWSPGSPIKSLCPREHRHAILVLHWVGLWSSRIG